MADQFVVRDALPSDCAEIHRLITGLAEYEKMPDQVDITVDQLREDGFGDGHPPRFFAFVVEKVGSPELVGYSMCNERYSTWKGRTAWIEDLYLIESCRRFGLGLRIFKKIVERAIRDKLARVEWNVLGWNTPAISFYKKINGVDMTETEEWHTYRLAPELFQNILDA